MDSHGVDEKLQEVATKAEGFYKGLSPVFCPALEEKVHFTADGFHHLQYKKSRNFRPVQDQLVRLRFLETGVGVLKLATTVQEYRQERQMVKKVGDGGVLKVSLVQYWGFVALGKNMKYRLRVVVRRVGNGQLHFWSVMPDWTSIKADDGSQIKVFAKVELQNI